MERLSTKDALSQALRKTDVVRSAVGHSVDGDDMHWTVCCPDCSKEFEYKGWFDSSEETKCKCGCVFRTTKVWLDDDHYIQ